MVTVATTLGRSGVHDWLLQRITAVIIFTYVCYLLTLIVLHQPINYFIWHAMFSNYLVKIMTILFALSLLIHTWIGMWTITTDYIKITWMRLSLQVVINILLLIELIWIIMVMWRV